MRYPFRYLIKDSPVYPALFLDRHFPLGSRHFLIAGTRALTILFLVLISLTPWVELFQYFGYGAEWWSSVLVKLFGFLFFALGCWIFFALNEVFYRHHLHRSWRAGVYPVTFEVGRVVYATQSGDLLRGLLLSPIGQQLLRRSGISPRETSEYLKERETKSLAASLSLKPGETLDFIALATILWQGNKDFQNFLAARVVTEEDWLGAASWVEAEGRRRETTREWWRREKLDQIPGLAKNWSYGETYHLDRYSDDLSSGEINLSEYSATNIHLNEKHQLEDILAREVGANALLVGGTSSDRLNILSALGEEIKSGRVTPELEHKRLLYFKTEIFSSAFRERAMFEQELIRLLTEANQAGNVILVLDDLAGFLAAGENFGANLEKLFEPFLISQRLQLIALMTTNEFNHRIGPSSELLNRFEKVMVTELGRTEIFELLERKAEASEYQKQMITTYPGLAALVLAAERYFTNESLADKSFSLLSELLAYAEREKTFYLTPAVVNKFLQEKTGVPLGEISTEERARLLNLGDILQTKIVGQKPALEAIASALKRSRTGVRNPKRPIASFLFLGPTGVGKTETAKALAQVFFGGEENLLRLDMSEYESAEALERLLGSFALGKPGVLAMLVRGKPYGVMLLDEFEKTRPEVLNIFLQILDEGFFTDALGARVNTRNLIFIATSNAGADFIWQLFKDNKTLENPDWSKNLIDELIKRGTFKPELLNRFDNTVIFQPLSPDDLVAVAKIILGRLVDRLKLQGVELLVNDVLINQVVALGANQAFGARPMVRLVQDEIEQVIADKLITGELRAGNKIEFRSPVAPEVTPREFKLILSIK